MILCDSILFGVNLREVIGLQHIFVDFEMNPILNAQIRTRIKKFKKSAKPATSNEIIQIGAVRLDSDYNVRDSFCCLVKPEYNTIESHIKNLTGISDSMVKGADMLNVAFGNFQRWIGDDETRIYAWSDADELQFKNECLMKGIFKEAPLPFQRKWMNFQRVYARILGVGEKTQYQLSLMNALDMAGIPFDGVQHNALDDAKNCAELLRLIKQDKKFVVNIKKNISFYKEGEQEVNHSVTGLWELLKIEDFT